MRAAREESTVVAPIVLDLSGETNATSLTTANTAAPAATATTAASSIPDLLTAAEYELMRVRAARVARFAYASSRSPTPPSNQLRILNTPAVKDSAAPSSELEAPIRAPTPRLSPDSLKLL